MGREVPGVILSPSFRRLLAAVVVACLGCAVAAASPRKRIRKPAHVKPVRSKAVHPKTVPEAGAGIENPQALAPFFDALRQLETPGSDRVVRVLHFGDSHTAADGWTGSLRLRLQTRFGNGGPGLILPARPWRGYPHAGVALLEGRGWPGTSLRERTGDGLVGFAGAAVFPPPEGIFRLRAVFGEYCVQTLGEALPDVQVEVVADPLSLPPIQGPSLTVPVPCAFEKTLANQERLRLLGQAGLSSSALQEMSIAFPPGCRFLGVDLRSGHGGIIYDELGLNGAELLDLERWNGEVRQVLLAETRPDLLVLAYGTNDMGRTDLDPQDYTARARSLFGALKQESGAAVLVVGPLDRVGTKRRQGAGLKAGAARIIHALREAATASGCAFWDARKAMGGEGSIVKWRRAGLAQRDLVHLTAPGYERLGSRMTEALMTALERTGRDRESE